VSRAIALAMGDVVRLVLRFRERSWESHEQLKDMNSLHAPGQPIPTLGTQSPLRVPILTAWAVGPSASRLRELLASWYLHDWRSDPYSVGAYSYVPAGALDAVPGHWGTVHAAIRTGQRAAAQVLNPGRK
jgi:hypothetical protein